MVMKRLTEEHKRKIGLSLRGRVFTLEHRRNLGASISRTRKRLFKEGKLKPNGLGIPRTGAIKRKISKTKKRKFTSGEYDYDFSCLHSVSAVRKMANTKRRLYREGILVPYWKNKHLPKSLIKKMIKTKIERGVHRLERNSNWRGGLSFEIYGLEFNNHLREDVRNFYGRLCMICFKPENGDRLAVHHIDYDKKNNLSENLISVHRGWCHSSTNHNRDFWKIYFRDIVRQWKAV